LQGFRRFGGRQRIVADYVFGRLIGGTIPSARQAVTSFP
jgi:hypothetical protein